MRIPLLILFLMMSLSLFSQVANKNFIDTAFIYKGFHAGTTSASFLFYSKSVDTARNVIKIQLDTKMIDTLNYLVGHVKSQRHLQQKVGPSFYASIIKDGRERRIVIVPNWAIIDIQNRRQYVFRNKQYFEIYNRFVDKNYR